MPNTEHQGVIRAAAEKIAAGVAAASIGETLRLAGVHLATADTTKLQASAAAGALTVREADKLLAGQSVEVRLRAKTALHHAGLLK